MTASKQAVKSFLVIGLVPLILLAQVPPSAFVNFEGAQTNPIRLSSDGLHLYVLNTPDARLSVFDITNASSPLLTAEIPVGIEPVSVNPRTADEIWVVNQESDSVSIVSVSKGIVTDTIAVKDEPSDVVFAGAYAFVSVARSNLINVYNVTTHALVKSLPVFGNNPRAMAVSPDGTKVYAAFALSGSHSTLVPLTSAPPQPPPTNPALPPPPAVGLIVDASNPNWSSIVKWNMPDNDVVVVDVNTLNAVSTYTGLGTINLGIAVRPGSGDLYVTNTNALNLIHFEPNLRGHFMDNRVTRVTVSSGQKTSFDLNPGINYGILPNPAALVTALSQPTATVFDPTGNNLYVAAFGTDRVAVLDSNGNIRARIEIGAATGSTIDPINKKGPRGLAINGTTNRLYVSNRLSNTVSIVDTTKNTVVGEVPIGSFDPTPAVIKGGRGFLYDAKLSGNGTGSCAGCHVDAEMDLLSWDLGDPGGSMATVVNNGVSFQMHPMKGAKTTQTLRGLSGVAPYHWRGDRADFTAFNPAFSSLMGGSQLSTTNMTAFTNFINTVVFQPNPFQNLDRTLPTTLFGGDPNAGQNTFRNVQFAPGSTCTTCHTDPGTGTNLALNQLGQPFKVPHLRNLYQKLNFTDLAGSPSIDGFGLRNDGHNSTLYELMDTASFGTFQGNPTIKRNISAYLTCFDTGMAPAVGYTRTVVAATISSASSDWGLLQAQAAAGNIDLIAKGTLGGVVHGLLYQPSSNNYKTDTTGLGPFTQGQLVAKISAGDTLSVMGVPFGSGVRMGIDRNLDGILDGDSKSIH